LAELGFVETYQSALAKVLQLVEVNAWIPQEHKLQCLCITGSSRELLPDVDLVGCKWNPLEERLDLVRHRSPRPQRLEDRSNSLAEIPAQLSNWVKPAFDRCHQFP
jgi:hypothetical protein